MIMIHRAIHFIFKLLFGDFNGVQAFLYPLTLFCWIDSLSFSFVVTGLLTIQRYYFPLLLFLLLFLYIAFLIIKNYSIILNDDLPNSETDKRIFFSMVIDVHLVLLFTLLCIGILYVFAAFMSYYYHISVPLKMIYPWALRIFSVLLIFYFGTRSYWMAPYRERDVSLDHAQRMMERDIHRYPYIFAGYCIALCLLMVMGSFLYYFLVINLIFPITLGLGFSPQLILIPVTSVPALFYDVFVIGAAFMLSNLLFSPISMLISRYARMFHPYNVKKHAKKSDQTQKA